MVHVFDLFEIRDLKHWESTMEMAFPEIMCFPPRYNSITGQFSASKSQRFYCALSMVSFEGHASLTQNKVYFPNPDCQGGWRHLFVKEYEDVTVHFYTLVLKVTNMMPVL